MNADGTGQMRLTESSKDPAWSPDGTKIAFASDRDGNYEIYVMNAPASGATVASAVRTAASVPDGT